MLRALIIDDELPAINGIIHSLDWTALQIDPPRWTTDIQDAREKLRGPVDIVICDIRMPGKTGLELFEETKDVFPNRAWIFLSAYAEFEYAQKALDLGADSYLLKPCSPKKLLAAAKKSADRLLQNPSRMRTNFTSLLEQFWRDILHGRVKSTQESLLKESFQRGLYLLSTWLFLPVLFSRSDGAYFGLPAELRRRLIDRIKEIIFAEEGNAILFEYEGRLVGFFHDFHYPKAPDALFSDLCESALVACKEELSVSLSCFLGQWTCADRVHFAVDGLIELDYRNTQGESRVFRFQQETPAVQTMSNGVFPSENTLIHLLENRKYTEAIELVKQSTAGPSRRGTLVSQDLLSFELNYIQCICYVLLNKGKSAHDFLENNRQCIPHETSSLRINDLFRWLDTVTRAFADYLSERQNDPVEWIDQVKEYVEKNLAEPLTRNTVAEAVYMNSDYLGRAFYKITGQFLSEYIRHLRIEKSKELLRNIELPVSFIATEVGFQGMSYFSKQFKDATHLSPSEYRKKAQSE